MSQVIKVFTPVKRVPTVIGKAQNGQKLPFGPYTLPQVAAAAGLLVLTATCAMNLPINPAATFVAGLVVTALCVFVLGLIPFTGVRLTSRILWVGRLLTDRRPVSASGVPIDTDSAHHTLFIAESVVVILSDGRGGGSSATERSDGGSTGGFGALGELVAGLAPVRAGRR
ncbi:hypothetical protein ACFXO9_30815 [Nocardia tengchongensis]|uniref:hypothetical protein n=1 Tax=Nocardia tengchongensis TaxID=2055889 RepID=UPI00368A1812